MNTLLTERALRSPHPRSFIAFGERPAGTPADQLMRAQDVRQPQPIAERIILQFMRKRQGDRATWPRGPLVGPATADDDDSMDGGGGSGGEGGSGGGGDGNDGDDEAPGPALSLQDVLAALEAKGVRIDRSSLANATELRKPINLPCGGKSGSGQRAKLRDAGAAIVRGVAAAVNPSGGEDAVTLIAESLIPPAPLEERQLAAAQAKVVENVLRSYEDAKRRGLSKAEQRQRLSALAPVQGRQGFTLPLLRKKYGLKISKDEWGMVRLHAAMFGGGGTAEADVPKPAGVDPKKLEEVIEFVYSGDNMQQVAFGSMDITLSTGETLEVPATMRTLCREKLFEDYASARRSQSGKRWFGPKNKPGSFRFNGVGRSKFLEVASIAAKGDLKQLGALDGIAEFSGRLQFEQLRWIARMLATLCPAACGSSMLDVTLARIDAVEVHIKRDLKAHLSHDDAESCAWHCANHAHADPDSADGARPRACEH